VLAYFLGNVTNPVENKENIALQDCYPHTCPQIPWTAFSLLKAVQDCSRQGIGSDAASCRGTGAEPADETD